tara:strand:+ start:4996 stop:5598 length:603 start_codon:yes stop_codon:yes gene_type:complete
MNSIVHFVKVTLTVYIFSMFLYAIWYFFQVVDLAKMNPLDEWIGSLVYLPHGARVLMFCYFRYYSLPGLYLAEISGPQLIHHIDYVDGWSLAALGSLSSVIIAVEIIKWVRKNPENFSVVKTLSFKNYKSLILVVLISAMLNGILANSLIAIVNSSITIDVLTVLRFMIGDILGAIIVIGTLWVIFTTLIDTRLIINPDD